MVRGFCAVCGGWLWFVVSVRCVAAGRLWFVVSVRCVVAGSGSWLLCGVWRPAVVRGVCEVCGGWLWFVVVSVRCVAAGCGSWFLCVRPSC